MRKRYLILLILLSLLSAINAQKSTEELLIIFEEGGENSGKAARYLGIRYDRIEDYEKAEFYFDKQIEIAEATKDDKLYFNGLFQKVKMNYFRSKPEKAHIYIDKIFERAKGDTSQNSIVGLARAYQYSAKIAQYYESDYEKAIRLFETSENYARSVGDANIFLQNKWDKCNIYYRQNHLSTLIEEVDAALDEVKSFRGKEPTKASMDDLQYFKAAAIGVRSQDSEE